MIRLVVGETEIPIVPTYSPISEETALEWLDAAFWECENEEMVQFYQLFKKCLQDEYLAVVEMANEDLEAEARREEMEYQQQLADERDYYRRGRFNG